MKNLPFFEFSYIILLSYYCEDQFVYKYSFTFQTSNIVITSPVKPKFESSAKDVYSLTSPVSKKQRRTNAQTIVAAIQEQLKFIKQDSMKPPISEDMSRCMDCEQVRKFRIKT